MFTSALVGFIITGILLVGCLICIYMACKHNKEEFGVAAFILGIAAGVVGSDAMERQKELEDRQVPVEIRRE